ncbi:two pore domain potassium channel family protein [Nocardioides sp. ChNu-153]|nr:potassium channel family protein [Nocardioides sp. ChNu-99]MDN7120683.1 two pore domain potassium channel family protein [Nocardioides sp. ChNu-153]
MLVQLGGILAYPFLGDSPTGRGLFSTIGLLVLVLAVFAVRATQALTWVSVVLGVPVVVLTVLEAVRPEDGIVVASSVLHAAFYLYTAYALIRYMFHDDHVTTDEIWATGATFTVVAWGFAYLYAAVQVVWPGSFTAAVDPEADRTWVELLFLSVTTLTSTGLSDVVPVLPHARSVVMIEQIAGMLYIALVIARVMALLSAREARRELGRGPEL